LRTRALAFVLALAAALGGCGGGGAPAAVCADDAPEACPSVAPRFVADAAPIIQAHCVKCHAPDGLAKKFPFETYDDIAPFAGDMKLELETCEMPPSTESALTSPERSTLFGWIACGALYD
jgi:uncharacterized membrane protein